MGSVISGGSIGGLLRYRSDALMPAINELGRLAIATADTINNQLGQGLDLNGDFGTSLFKDINSAIAVASRSQAAAGNSAASSNLNVAITDSSKLTTYDYKITFSDKTNPNMITVGGRTGSLSPRPRANSGANTKIIPPTNQMGVPSNTTHAKRRNRSSGKNNMRGSPRFFFR